MKSAELRTIQVKDLKPAAYNPRKKLKPGDPEYEKIKNSIEEFGFADPLVVNADKVDTKSLEWEYECEGKDNTKLQKNTAFGSLEGFTSTTTKKYFGIL